MDKLKSKIFVLEDDLAIQEVVKIILEDNGYQVAAFTNCDEFLKRLNSGTSPDLILLDIWLGNEDGKKIAKDLKSHKKFKNIPLIIFSANNDIVKIYKEVKADGFLSKPFSMNNLLKLVKKFT